MDESWRVAAAVVFVLLAPGASLVPLVGLRDTGVELALVVPLSIATVILTAVALFYTNTWTPDREFAVLVGICAVAVAGRVIADIVRSPRTDLEGSPTGEFGHGGIWFWFDEGRYVMPETVLMLVPLSVRQLSAVYFVPFVALVVILIERELIRAMGGDRSKAAGRVLDLASAPLLVAFAVLVLLRLDYIF